MKNLILSNKTAHDIDNQIAKVLRGLGNPEPPLDISAVLYLLELDRTYYTSDDVGLLAEVTHRIRVAGKQILNRPSMLWEAIKSFDLKALYLPDQNRILIDQSLPKLKHRWNEAHEISHKIIPWHADMLLGDTTQTLSKGCHEQIEAEANHGAGSLLFMGEHFTRSANDCLPTFNNIISLSRLYGNTITTTLWRYIERSHDNLNMFGIISDHPHNPTDTPPTLTPCQHFIQSRSFAAQFADADVVSIFRQVTKCCSHKTRQIIGEGIIQIPNIDGQLFNFNIVIFSNTYQTLTLGVCSGEKPITIYT